MKISQCKKDPETFSKLVNISNSFPPHEYHPSYYSLAQMCGFVT